AVRGLLKSQPDDFVVEEVPAYLPCGEGEHLFLWVEKEGVAAEQLVQHVARNLGISRQEIGVAGLKDRQAITRQWISVPAAAEGQVDAVTTQAIRVLERRRHRNKLKTGHLRGNRFAITLREVPVEDQAKLPPLLDEIARSGVPNYYGDQRFGRDGETLRLGLELLRGETAPQTIPFARRKFLLRLALNSVQSMLFNAVVADRLRAGQLLTVQPGDLMQVVESGGVFAVEDAAIEQARFESGETVVTGPLFGPKMKQPTGQPGDWERSVLERHGIAADSFAKFPKLTSGARRPMLLRPNELQGTGNGDAGTVTLRFVLPSGCYATVLMREINK
ncbi:MAG: tRNA pseudouridine(13) synthase TruD, partial [Planctomycetaceae bacterium]|nr:tRNA pseudouridine(13) synthase TruD [Planctomycetaceae bacterium]